MPSTFTDFLQTYMGLKQIQNQTEQIAQRAKESAVTGMDTFLSMARHTANPMEQTALVDRFSQLGVASKDQLLGMLQHVTPSLEAQKEYDVWRGRQNQDSGGTNTNATPEATRRQNEAANVNATGMSSGQLGSSAFISDMLKLAPRTQANADEMASRLSGGMTVGETAVDQATANLPASELTQAAGAKAGTRMTAAQDANNQATWAQIRGQDRKTATESAFQMGSLEVDAAKARAAAAGHDPAIVDHLIQAKTQLMATLKDAKTKNPSAQEIMSFIGGLNAINSQMTNLGIPNEGQIDYNPADLVQPGFVQRFMSGPVGQKLFGQQSMSKPRNAQPAGTGRQ